MILCQVDSATADEKRQRVLRQAKSTTDKEENETEEEVFSIHM